MLLGGHGGRSGPVTPCGELPKLEHTQHFSLQLEMLFTQPPRPKYNHYYRP